MIVLLLYAVMQSHDVRVLQFSTDPRLALQLLKVCKTERNSGGLVIPPIHATRIRQLHYSVRTLWSGPCMFGENGGRLPREVNFFVLIIFAANSRPVDF